MAPDEALHEKIGPATAQRVAIVLEPLTHPELDAIHIDDSLFAIGRAEAPFADYAPELVADLSRRHARVFVEHGAAYLADLGSKNGTTVNGMPVQQAIARLRDGDVLGFGRALSYGVRLKAVDAGPAPPARLASLTLQPEHPELGLEPIVISRFPFLVSKVDATFARYRQTLPHQVGCLSRRHAHIFLKGGVPYVEDLGSTNGTCVGALRLDEHAHELKDGDLLAFGGRHFVYRVSLQWQHAPDPTVTRAAPSVAEPGEVDKTTFVAAPGSFLDIFCVDRAAQDDELNYEASPANADGTGGTGRPRGKFGVLVAGILDAFGGAGDVDRMHRRSWAMALAAALVALGLILYSVGAPEREVKRLVATGDYATAAMLASERLARQPNNADMRAYGTEAVLKAGLPNWTDFLKARQFDKAAAELAHMRSLSRNNPDLQPLLAEIDWIGRLEQFVGARGGANAPVSGSADQNRIRLILKQWQDDAQSHQRAFATISSYVPAFRDTYAQALSDLRKLALVGGAGGNEQ
ncbi:MAG: FHA domain-containing protein [Massilia sp.]